MRWLILGGGAIVSQAHLPALIALGWDDGSTIVERAAPAIDRLKSLMSRAEICMLDYQQVLAQADLCSRFDAVLIALPNNMHADAAMLCIERGIPVLCEKPLAISSEEIIRIGRFAQEKGVFLGVAMVRRFIPTLEIVRDAIARGLIGRLVSVDIAHGGRFSWPSESGLYFRKENGGILLNMGVHYLDAVTSLFGALALVSHYDDRLGGVEANSDSRFQSETGVDVRLRLSYTHKLPNELIFKGTTGVLRHSVDASNAVEWAPDGGSIGTLHSKTPYRSGNWKPGFVSSFVEQFFDFSQALSSSGQPRVSADAAASVAALIEQCNYQHKPFEWLSRPAPDRPRLETGPALVTGGSGFVGTRLLERLEQLGFERVSAPVRSPMSAAPVARMNVDIPVINLLDRSAVRELVKGKRWVFHLAFGRDGADEAKFTVESTRVLVEEAIAQKCESVVVVSSAIVFGAPGGAVDEDSPYREGLGDYGKSKAEAERLALSLAAKSAHTRVVVISPSSVFGPTGPTFCETPVRFARAGSFFWVDEGSGNANFIFVDNLVDAIVLAASSHAAQGRRFIASDGVTTWRELLGPIMGSRAGTCRSVSMTEVAAQSQASSTDLRSLVGALLLDNTRFIAAVSAHKWLGPAKRLLARLVPRLQQRVQQRRSKDWRDDVFQAPKELGLSNLWLASLFGPNTTEYRSSRAQHDLGWSSGVDLNEAHARVLAWLEFIGLSDSDSHKL